MVVGYITVKLAYCLELQLPNNITSLCPPTHQPAEAIAQVMQELWFLKMEVNFLRLANGTLKSDCKPRADELFPRRLVQGDTSMVRPDKSLPARTQRYPSKLGCFHSHNLGQFFTVLCTYKPMGKKFEFAAALIHDLGVRLEKSPQRYRS